MLTPLLPFDAASLYTAKSPWYITFLLLCKAAVKQTVAVYLKSLLLATSFFSLYVSNFYIYSFTSTGS